MSEKSSGFGVGFAVGALVGLVAGVMFAPHSGKETREIIKEKAKSFVARAKAAYPDGHSDAAAAKQENR